MIEIPVIMVNSNNFYLIAIEKTDFNMNFIQPEFFPWACMYSPGAIKY